MNNQTDKSRAVRSNVLLDAVENERVAFWAFSTERNRLHDEIEERYAQIKMREEAWKKASSELKRIRSGLASNVKMSCRPLEAAYGSGMFVI